MKLLLKCSVAGTTAEACIGFCGDVKEDLLQ